MKTENMTPHSIADAVSILRQHNAWRRFDGDQESDGAPQMCDPRELGRAIDMAVDFILGIQSKPLTRDEQNEAYLRFCIARSELTSAIESKSDLDSEPENEMLRRQIVQTVAQCTNPCIWLSVFSHDADMFERIMKVVRSRAADSRATKRLDQ